MATVGTTTRSDPLQYPGTRHIDRYDVNGHLYAAVLNNAGTGVDFYRSTNGGATWALLTAWAAGRTIAELGSMFIDPVNRVYWVYRATESGQDRIYFAAAVITAANTFSLHSQLLVAAAGNGGVAGSVYSGADVIAIRHSNGQSSCAVAVGTASGTNHGVTLFGVSIPPTGQPTLNNALFATKRQWLVPGAGRITPALGYELSPAHLWVTHGRTAVRVVRCAGNGNGWTTPSADVLVQAGVPALDSMNGVMTHWGWAVAVPNPSDTTTVALLERSLSNASTTTRISPAHPAGVVRHCAISFDWHKTDVRVYAVGTTNTNLYYADWIRATGAWTAWTQVPGTTAVLGSTGLNYGVRRRTHPSARYDVLTAHTGTPNTILHTSQIIAYAPNPPVWDTAAIGYASGAAADVAAALNLTWTFSDPDPADTQAAYALSRQIGVGAISYFRASDSTWQATEQKNVSGTTARSLAAAWGLTTDAPHAYRVKVWDQADVASEYSDAFVVVPSGKVNPTVTSPTESQVITQDTLSVTWTVAEQSAYRVRLQILAAVVYDSGWVAGTATSHEPEFVLGNQFSYSLFVQTRNLLGLPSNEVQRNFSVAFLEPAHASLLLTPLPALGVIRAAITNPAPVGSQPAVASQELYRRPFLSPYIVEHDFETADLSGWGPPTGGTAARSTAQAHKGAWSYQLTPNGIATDAYVETVKIPCTAGVEYFLDCWIRGTSATKAIFAQIRWYTAGDVFISAANGLVIAPPAAAGAWEFRWVSGPAPPTAAKMTLLAVVGNTPGVGDLIHVDEVRVRVDDHDQGVRVVSGLPSGATFDDWRAASGVAYEYRVQTRSVIGTAVGGVWTA